MSINLNRQIVNLVTFSNMKVKLFEHLLMPTTDFSLVFPSFLCFHNSSKLHLFFFSHLRPWLTGFDGSREKLFFFRPIFFNTKPLEVSTWNQPQTFPSQLFRNEICHCDITPPRGSGYHASCYVLTNIAQNIRSNFQN